MCFIFFFHHFDVFCKNSEIFKVKFWKQKICCEKSFVFSVKMYFWTNSSSKNKIEFPAKNKESKDNNVLYTFFYLNTDLNIPERIINRHHFLSLIVGLEYFRILNSSLNWYSVLLQKGFSSHDLLKKFSVFRLKIFLGAFCFRQLFSV